MSFGFKSSIFSIDVQIEVRDLGVGYRFGELNGGMNRVKMIQEVVQFRC